MHKKKFIQSYLVRAVNYLYNSYSIGCQKQNKKLITRQA